MGYKLAWFFGVIITLVLVVFILREKEQGSFLDKGPVMTRSATNIIMFERKKDTGKTMEISAREVVETADEVAHFRDFLVLPSGGLRLSGKDAFYDRTRSILKMPGKVSIENPDGAKAQLTGLIWDRQSMKAHTDNPVRLEGKDGIITADRAEFTEEFTNIAFIGRVHARIIEDILNY